MRRVKLGWFLLLFVLIAVVAAVLGDEASITSQTANSAFAAEKVVRRFIALMQEGAMEDLYDIVVHRSFGSDPNPPPALVRDLPLGEAEAQGLIKPHTSEAQPSEEWVIGVLSRQRAFVLEQFGADAWEKADFRLELVPRHSELQWVDAKGKTVNSEAAQAMLVEFLQNIGQQEGVDLSVLYRPRTDYADDQGYEEALFQAMRVFAQYREQAPVRLVPVPVTFDYLAHFSFGGETTGRDGFRDFYLRLIFDGNVWRVESLQWSPPPYEGPDV